MYIHEFVFFFFFPLQKLFSLCIAVVISSAAVDCWRTPTTAAMRRELTFSNAFLLAKNTRLVFSLLCPESLEWALGNGLQVQQLSATSFSP